jgi:hypothetical protein
MSIFVPKTSRHVELYNQYTFYIGHRTKKTGVFGHLKSQDFLVMLFTVLIQRLLNKNVSVTQ